MSVKSRISNKTYTSSLELLEPEDRDVDSELYQITISDRDILIAPGKNRMEDGIAYGYAYAIRQNKVVCKLGVYEKKTDKMPLIFDLSMFPEGSMCLFDEYIQNPSLLMGLEMSTTQTVFDYLIPLYEKLPDKQKRLKQAYRTLVDLYNKDKEKSKGLKPIIAAVSAASKTADMELLVPLQEKVSDPKTADPRQFVYIMLVLQYVFQIEFKFRTDDPELIDLISRWKVDSPTTLVEVDVYTQEMIQERPYQATRLAPEEMSQKEVSQEGDPDIPNPPELPQEVPSAMPAALPEALPPVPESRSLFTMPGPPDPYMDVLPDKQEPARPEPVRKRATKPKTEAVKVESEVPALEITKRKPRVGTSLNDVTVAKTSESTESEPIVKTKKPIRLKKPSKQEPVAL